MSYMHNQNHLKYKIVEDDHNLYNVKDEMQQHIGSGSGSSSSSSSCNSEYFDLGLNGQNNRNTNMHTEYTNDIYAQFQRYKLAHPHTKVYILTPCFGSTCYVNYVLCLMKTIEFFKQQNIAVCIEFCKNDSLVSRARNNLVAKAMTDTQCTHILFIDNDISWNPVDILKLIVSEKPLVGGVYPLKHYDWTKVSSPTYVADCISRKNASILKTTVTNEDMLQHNMLQYNVNYIDKTLTIHNNLARVKHLATGFMMIRREMMEQMMVAYSETKYIDDVQFLQSHENAMAYALFDCGVREGHYFSEDWLFCDRWSKLGGEIYIDVSINLCHTGIEDYSGSYISSII